VVLVGKEGEEAEEMVKEFIKQSNVAGLTQNTEKTIYLIQMRNTEIRIGNTKLERP